MSATRIDPGGVLSRAAELDDEVVAPRLGLAAVDAPSGDAAALRDAETVLAAELRATGGELRRHPGPAGTHLELRVGPVEGPPVLVLCHYDTVWPAGTAARRPAGSADGWVHGPGTYDMRGGIVAVLGALRLLAPVGPSRPVRVLLTADEETGSATARDLILRHGREAALVLVPEPPLAGGALKTARKGWAVYRLETRGRAAHAGIEPERGVSAADELVDQLLRVRMLADPHVGTTVNVGTVQGGTAANVVAEGACAELDVRATCSAEQTRVDHALVALAPVREGADVRVHRLHMRPPMERTAAIAEMFTRARELAATIGISLREGSAGGTSDGNLVGALGVPVLDGLGPEGAGAHALDERVRIASLTDRAALIALLIEGLKTDVG